jgi:ABC-type dipeptide/oligopeptide/nickel transport system permease subunit
VQTALVFATALVCLAWWARSGYASLALDVTAHLALPLGTVVLLSFGETLLTMRATMLETMGADHVTAARARGLPESVLRYRHMAPAGAELLAALPGASDGNDRTGSDRDLYAAGDRQFRPGCAEPTAVRRSGVLRGRAYSRAGGSRALDSSGWGRTGAGAQAIIVKSQTLSLRAKPYIEAAHAAGGGRLHVFRRHVLPGLLPLTAVNLFLTVVGAVLTESLLSYFNRTRVDLSWGTMIWLGQETFRRHTLQGQWHAILPPAMAIMLFCSAFYLVGRALDEVLNPRLRAR